MSFALFRLVVSELFCSLFATASESYDLDIQ